MLGVHCVVANFYGAACTTFFAESELKRGEKGIRCTTSARSAKVTVYFWRGGGDDLRL